MLRGKSVFRIGSTHGIGLEIAPVLWPGRVQYPADSLGTTVVIETTRMALA